MHRCGAIPEAADILARLQAETRLYHSDVDAIWLDLFTGELTVAQYVAVLMRVYGFKSSIEAALAYTPRLQSMVDLRGRVHSGLIAQDLMGLGFGTAQVAGLPLCPIAPFATPAEALGWMYVVQRSSALHAQIKQHVEARLPQVRCGRGLSYLSISSARAVTLASELGTALEVVVRDERTADHVISGACDAFRRLVDWFQPAQPRHTRPAETDLTNDLRGARAAAPEPESRDEPE